MEGEHDQAFNAASDAGDRFCRCRSFGLVGYCGPSLGRWSRRIDPADDRCAADAPNAGADANSDACSCANGSANAFSNANSGANTCSSGPGSNSGPRSRTRAGDHAHDGGSGRSVWCDRHSAKRRDA